MCGGVHGVAWVRQAVVIDEGKCGENCFSGSGINDPFAFLSTFETDAVDDENSDQTMELILNLFSLFFKVGDALIKHF